VRFFQRSGLPREQLSRARGRSHCLLSPEPTHVAAAPTRRPAQVWVIADNARQGYLGYNEFVKARARRGPRASRRVR
jgi:hypothetical protein